MPISTKDAPGLIAGGSSSEGGTKMARIKATRNTVAGGMDLVEGKTYELAEDDALALIRMGKAVPAPARGKKSDTRQPKVKKR